jgi:hypothetical protein
MKIRDDVRKCVVFVGYRLADGTMRMAGSAFFLGKKSEEGKASNSFLVTARHVIEGIRRLGLTDVFIRANTAGGESVWSQCQSNDWLFHPTDPTVDVALLRTGIPSQLDHLIFPHSLCATDEVIQTNEVGLGDEVFIVGLFRHHHGNRRNIPIVRVGNLAAMTEEKVATRAFGLVDAYLIEARSIGGLSGSPVFLNLGVVRYIDGNVKHAQGGPMCFLLGLVHGHYDVPASSIDACQLDGADALSTEHINTGMAIVVPMHKIFEAIAAHTTQ